MRRRSREASLKLDVVVVGGGIGGLAVAYMLSESGHSVRVLEKHALPEYGAGIRVPPNLSKILLRWFGARKLAQATVQLKGIPWHHLESGKPIGFLPWPDAIIREAGGEFLLMHHGDLHRMLYDLARRSGVQIQWNTPVQTAILQGGKDKGSQPSIALSNGEVIIADIIIGADGPQSIIRKSIFGPSTGPSTPNPVTIMVHSATVSDVQVSKDPELQAYIQSNEWQVFMGSHRSLSAHPVREKRELTFHIRTHEFTSNPPKYDDGWNDCIPSENFPLDGFGPQLQRLIKMAPHLICSTSVLPMSDPDDWSDASGKFVLVGEAAHPWLPGGAFGASMAVEDAVVLGTLFSRLRSREQVPTFLHAYQELRKHRCEHARRTEQRHAQLSSLPPGPITAMRDKTLKGYIIEDERSLKAHFDELGDIISYDAAEAADEWWVSWGRHMDPKPEGDFDFFDYEVTTIEGDDDETDDV